MSFSMKNKILIASKRYIIPSGAFAESKKGRKSGLYKMSEQERVKKGSNTKQNNKKHIV